MNSLTIAIPTYKSNMTLERLLDSILESPASLNVVSEILISDNDPDSTFGSKIEQKYYQKPKIPIRYLKNNRNLGYDGNLYRLSQECKTELIKFIADDELVTNEFFLSLKHIFELGLDIDIIVHNFRTQDENIISKDKAKNSSDRFQFFTPYWTHDQVELLCQLYGQVSSLTFNNNLLRKLPQPVESNYIHIFWFFSILERSNVLVDWETTIIVSLGSPNFSQNQVRILTVPRGGVIALQETEFIDLNLGNKLIDDMRNYCLMLLRAVHRLKYSERFQVLLCYRKDLVRKPFYLLRLSPNFLTPRHVAKLLMLIRDKR